MPGDERRYDAFISYSYQTDGPRLAPAVQRGLQRLTVPWYRRSPRRIFRDHTSLPAGSNLGQSIEEALADSRYFVLMASPAAARSAWVCKEVQFWQENREPETFVIVLTDGTINWDKDKQDFDWAQTDALPERLSGYFEAEPLWLNLQWAREGRWRPSLWNARFRLAMATLAGNKIIDKDVDRLYSIDARLHRIATVVRSAVTLALAVLMVLATGFAIDANRSAAAVAEQRNQALSRALAASSEAMGDRDPVLSRLLSVAAWRISPTPQARAGMLRVATRPGIAVLTANDPQIKSVGFSPDGKTLVAAGDKVRLWDVTTHHQVGTPYDHKAEWTAFSPDGRLLAIHGDDSQVRFWDTASRQIFGEPLVLDQSDHYLPVKITSVAFSANSRMVATGGDDGRIQLFDVDTRRQAGVLSGEAVSALGSGQVAFAFRPQDMTAASAANDGTVRFWDLTRRQQIGDAVSAHATDVTTMVGPAVAFSPDGTVLATAGIEGTVRLWDAAKRQQIGSPLTGHTRSERMTTRPSVAFSQDGKLLATGSLDGTVHLWDVARQRQIGPPLAGHSGPVSSVAFSPDRTTVASASQDGTVRLWNVDTLVRLANPLAAHQASVHAVAFSPDGTSLLSSSDYGGLIADHGAPFACSNSGWRICLNGRGWMRTVGEGQDSMVNVVRTRGTDTNAMIDEWESRMVDGPTVVRWDVAGRRQSASLRTSTTRTIRAVAYSPDGKLIAAGGMDGGPGSHFNGRWLLREAGGGPLASVAVGEARVIRSVAFSPDGKTLAMASDRWGDERHATASVWDVATWTKTELPNDTSTFSVAFSPDGRTLASSGVDGRIRLWHTGTRQSAGELTGHTGPTGSVAFSPDGKTLASAGDDGTIRLWDVASLRQLGEPITGHTGPVYSVAFSPDGRLLASGSGDNSVRVWDVTTRTQVSDPILGHSRPVRSVKFSPDGRSLASGGEDTMVRMWDVGYAVDIVKSLCDKVKRDLTADEWARYVPDVEYRTVC
ncbi:TIR domain-containing protein [Kibdelosporangium aridum]|uniref:TIR domain-containing protein n=1 Tax=Kibdelosporangium aridum TaxID=2030 RepID=A0A428ZQY5_KIBAR|nr:TIR domain-containing protein [Kibdelosporangium aridum]RSM90393.1 TIR domain-containing protein [Kibdelosporangium aridum]